MIFWADGKINDAVACEFAAEAAELLGIEESEMNSCTPNQAGYYKVSLRNDPFENSYGDPV